VVWNAPCLPVMPWQSTLVERSTRMAMGGRTLCCKCALPYQASGGEQVRRRAWGLSQRAYICAAAQASSAPQHGLGITNASIVPAITSGNANSLMIAEQAAAKILEYKRGA
jgi:hypothetical protein